MQQPNSALDRDNDCGESTREHCYDRDCSCEQCMMKRESNLEVEVDTDGPSVKRHRTESVKHEHEVKIGDGDGDDPEANEEGELDEADQQVGGGGGGSVQSDQLNHDDQVNHEQNVNVIREEDATQLLVDIISAHQIEQSQHDQEEHRHLSDIEHELQMLRNVFMKPIENAQFGELFLCDYPKCGKRLGPYEQQQIAHLKLHTKPYVCDFDGCLRRFTSPSTCIRHTKTHTVNVLQCDLPGCMKRFKNIGNLNLHKRDHTDPKMTICGWADCDKVFYSEGNFVTHYLTHSDDGIDDDQLVCDWVDCARKFTTQYNLSIHCQLHTDKSHFDIQLRPFACVQCGATFAQVAHLVTHRLSHAPNGSGSADNFVKHIETDHLGNKFECDFAGCGKRTKLKCRLIVHIRSHTGEKPFKCSVEGCELSFAQRYDLNYHLETHSYSRRFVCHWPGCGQVFARLSSLSSHARYHPKDRPFVCPSNGCVEAFKSESALEQHQKATHTVN